VILLSQSAEVVEEGDEKRVFSVTLDEFCAGDTIDGNGI
jgi:hypothetical protein